MLYWHLFREPQEYGATLALQERIRDEVLAFHFGPEPVSLSIGATQFTPGESAEILIGRAESALAKAIKSDDKKIETL